MKPNEDALVIDKLVQNVSECRCLIHNMARNAEAETMTQNDTQTDLVKFCYISYIRCLHFAKSLYFVYLYKRSRSRSSEYCDVPNDFIQG